MELRIDVDCTDEERELINRAAEAANAVLKAAAKTDEDPLWTIAYIELEAQVYEPLTGGRVQDPSRFLAADGRL